MSPTQINDANLGEDIQPHLKKINRKRYPKVQGTYLLYFVPSIGDPVSMLACALNSGELRKFFEDETVVNSNEISFKLSFYRKIKTDSPIKA